MKHLRCFFLVRPIALWAFRSLKMAWLEFASSLPGQYTRTPSSLDAHCAITFAFNPSNSRTVSASPFSLYLRFVKLQPTRIFLHSN